MHLTDDELILHYYGEDGGAARSRAGDHLAECTTCAGSYAALQAVLNAVDACPAPDLPEQFERVVWARLAPEIESKPRVWFWWPLSPARLGWIGALMVVVAGAFFAGRMSHSDSPSPRATPELARGDIRERVLLADLAEHLDRSQQMLIELASADATEGSSITAERGRAEQLVSDNRLYRQSAAATGNNNLVMVLDDLERVLVDVAAGPQVMSAAEVKQVRREIESNELIFKVRVLSSEVRDRQKAAMQLRASRSS
jgi:hypothetical protein